MQCARKTNHNQSDNCGFSLIEMAIVLIVVGLIVTGVFVGKSMVEQAEDATLAAETKNIAQAVAEFQKTYNAVPGDMANASSYFQGVANGDGDGLVEDDNNGAVAGGVDERPLFWQHLQVSGLVSKQMKEFNAGVGALTSPQASSNVAAVYQVRQDANLGLVMDLTGAAINAGVTQTGLAAFSPDEAKNIEKLFGDDGNPATGAVRASDGSNVAAGSCVTGGTYAVGETASCQMVLALEQKLQSTTTQAQAVACGTIGQTRYQATTLGNCGAGLALQYEAGGTTYGPRGMVETCMQDGTWQPDFSYCKPIYCEDEHGRHVVGEHWLKECPAGYRIITPPGNAPDYECVEQADKTGMVRLSGGAQITTYCETLYGNCTPPAPYTPTMTKSQACPAPKVGTFNLVCSAGGVWVEDNVGMASCSEPDCSGVAVGGSAGTAACPTGWTGTQALKCIAEGTSVADGSACTLNTSEGCPTLNAYRTISCPGGMSGQLRQQCRTVGATQVWVNTGEYTCEKAFCGNQPVGVVRDTTTPCPSDSVGMVREYCDSNGTWKPLACAKEQCGNVTEGNATWPATDRGVTNVLGTCNANGMTPPQYTMGWGAPYTQPRRDCTNSGDYGQWGAMHMGRNSDGAAICMRSCYNTAVHCGTASNDGAQAMCNLATGIHDQPSSPGCPGGRWTVGSPGFSCQNGTWVWTSGVCYSNCWNGGGWTTHNTYQTRGVSSGCGGCNAERRMCNNGSFGGWGCYSWNPPCPPPPPPPPPPAPSSSSSGSSSSSSSSSGGCSTCMSCCGCSGPCACGCCYSGCGPQQLCSACSDIRVKDNIVLVGRRGGINIYQFNYIGDSVVYEGVMAQEVEHLPGVVSYRSDGIRMVDYSRLGFPMRRISP